MRLFREANSRFEQFPFFVGGKWSCIMLLIYLLWCLFVSSIKFDFYDVGEVGSLQL